MKTDLYNSKFLIYQATSETHLEWKNLSHYYQSMTDQVIKKQKTEKGFFEFMRLNRHTHKCVCTCTQNCTEKSLITF